MSKSMFEKAFEWVAYSESYKPFAFTSTVLLSVGYAACLMLAEAPDNNQEANQPTETLTFQKFATVDECKESTGNIDGCSIYFEAVNSDKEIELVDTGDAHTLPNHDALDI